MLCLSDHARDSALAKYSEHFEAVWCEHQDRPFEMHPSGTYDRKSVQAGLSARTRLVALSHVHHLYGMEMDLPELQQIIRLMCSSRSMLVRVSATAKWMQPNSAYISFPFLVTRCLLQTEPEFFGLIRR